jgi:HEPN domain-containing protein
LSKVWRKEDSRHPFAESDGTDTIIIGIARMTRTGGTDYRSGAQDRLEEAAILLRSGRFGGSVYLAGRAVEGMLRAVIWESDHEYALGKKTLDTGHDLHAMLKLIRNLGVLRDHGIPSSMTEHVQNIARLWSNNMRFLSTTKIEAMWYNLGEIDNDRRTMKQASKDFFDACSAVIKRCEAIWQRTN